MDYITSTELRTKTKELIETLKQGGSVTLVHRSQKIGIIGPRKITQTKTVNETQGAYVALEKLQKSFADKYDLDYDDKKTNGKEFLDLVKGVKPAKKRLPFKTPAERKEYYRTLLLNKYG